MNKKIKIDLKRYIYIYIITSVAQWIRRDPSKVKIAGSSPAWGILYLFEI